MVRLLAFALGVVLSLGPILARSAATPTQRWLVVSDIHFDPLANPRRADRLIAEPAERWRSVFSADGADPFSDYGHDTNDALFESALDAMHSADGDPAVVLITGDFLAHDFRAHFDRFAKVHDNASYDAFVDKTIAFLALEFRAAFPGARILPVIGNNDGYCSDYLAPKGDGTYFYFGPDGVLYNDDYAGEVQPQDGASNALGQVSAYAFDSSDPEATGSSDYYGEPGEAYYGGVAY